MKIKTIRLLSPQSTGDIEVENTHSYQLENGCVSHNTISQLVDCSSGIHTRHNEYYLRTVRADNSDPLCKFMIESGFPHEKCVTNPDYVTVFSFPMVFIRLRISSS